MRMRQYICHTDHNLWDVIVNGDLEEEPAPTGDQSGPSAPPAPKTAKQLAARRNQERVKSILLLAIPDEYLLKFHNVADAKSLWEAIKSRFGGNVESKKMQKNVLKHQFENFSTASNESLDKAYDRFQKLISQLEVHGAPISKEDINQKFLRSLPSSWNQIALIMRNKLDIDEIDIDDLYNNLRVYEDELKRSSGSNSASQNLAFLSSENTGGTNELTTFLLPKPYKQSLTGRDEDFQQIDGVDLEELDFDGRKMALLLKKCGSGRNQGRRSYGDNGRSNAPTNESSSQDCHLSSSVSEEKHEQSKREIGVMSSPIESLESRILGHEKMIGYLGKTNDANTEKPKSASESIVSNPKINRDRVIIEDWKLDDEEEEYEVQTVRPKTQIIKTRDDKSGQNSKKQGIGFRKVKACFVCKRTDY
ncbi:hypothetical protein Tco_0808814 [Tanacetum coccineum]